MVFNFFGLKKEPVVEDVVAKPPSKPEAAPAAKTFEEAYAQQRAVEAAAMTKSEVPVSPSLPAAPAPAAKPEDKPSEPPKVDMNSYEGRLEFLQKRLAGLHNGMTTLSPLELVASNDHLPKKVLIVGHCSADNWGFHKSNLTKTPVDFLLVNNLQTLPQRSAEDLAGYDFQVINFPLRFVFQDNMLWGAIKKTDEELETLFKRSVASLKALFDLYLQYNATNGLLTFVTNFMTPSVNPLGKLMPHYDLRNPQYYVDRLNQELERMVRERSNAYVINLDSITSYFGKRYMQEDLLNLFSHGSYMPGNLKDETRIEHAPPLTDHYRLDYMNFLGVLWVEFISAFRIANPRHQVKLIVVDLDDTLWTGAVGELDNPDISIAEGWPSGLLEALSYFKDRGGMLAIVSKNYPEVVQRVWKKFYEARFPLSNFVAVKCSFSPKSQMIAEVLQETNLTDVSVLVIDDNPVERAEIKMAFPKMRLMHGYHYYWRKVLLLAAETQVAFLSDEAVNKTELMKSQIERQTQMSTSHSREAFLAELNVNTKLKRLSVSDDKSLERCFELLNKTNQFNTTGVRWQMAEFRAFVESDAVYYFEVQDRLTHYGIVGVALLKGASIEQLVMSCRVVGLDVEYGVLKLLLAEIANKHADQPITAKLGVTDKNLLCQAIFGDCGFEKLEGSDVWRLVEFKPPSFQGAFELVA
jgi:FkbH-like protein